MYVRFRAVAFIVWKLVQSQTLVLQSWRSGALLGHTPLSRFWAQRVSIFLGAEQGPVSS